MNITFSCFTCFTELIKVPVSEVLGMAAKLRAPFPRGHLEVVLLDPLRHPAQLAVTGQKSETLVWIEKGGKENDSHWRGGESISNAILTSIPSWALWDWSWGVRMPPLGGWPWGSRPKPTASGRWCPWRPAEEELGAGWSPSPAPEKQEKGENRLKWQCQAASSSP